MLATVLRSIWEPLVALVAAVISLVVEGLVWQCEVDKSKYLLSDSG